MLHNIFDKYIIIFIYYLLNYFEILLCYDKIYLKYIFKGVKNGKS